MGPRQDFRFLLRVTGRATTNKIIVYGTYHSLHITCNRRPHPSCRKFAASVDPETAPYDVIAEEEDVEVQMPSPETQKFLLQLYFTYVHPFYPVIHKQDFLYQYNAL